MTPVRSTGVTRTRARCKVSTALATGRQVCGGQPDVIDGKGHGFALDTHLVLQYFALPARISGQLFHVKPRGAALAQCPQLTHHDKDASDALPDPAWHPI